MTERRADRWATMLVVTAAICGLLAMHAFEAVLVHADHTDVSGHVSGVEASAAEVHVQHGACSLEKPGDSPTPVSELCPVHAFAPATPLELAGASREAVTLANRTVLIAFSILRV